MTLLMFNRLKGHLSFRGIKKSEFSFVYSAFFVVNHSFFERRGIARRVSDVATTVFLTLIKVESINQIKFGIIKDLNLHEILSSSDWYFFLICVCRNYPVNSVHPVKNNTAMLYLRQDLQDQQDSFCSSHNVEV